MLTLSSTVKPLIISLRRGLALDPNISSGVALSEMDPVAFKSASERASMIL